MKVLISVQKKAQASSSRRAFLVAITTMLLIGCGVTPGPFVNMAGLPYTWNLYDETDGANIFFDDIEDSPDTMPDENTVVIERAPGRRSPRINVFRHIDLNIYKESAGSRWNTSDARTGVLTPPGRIEIGVVVGKDDYPSAVFTAEAGRTYWITWLCSVPDEGDIYTWFAIVDAESGKIIETNYIPRDLVVGETLTSSTKCQ